MKNPLNEGTVEKERRPMSDGKSTLKCPYTSGESTLSTLNYCINAGKKLKAETQPNFISCFGKTDWKDGWKGWKGGTKQEML